MDREDLKKYKAMKAILHNGKFEVKGDAVLLVASLFDWFNKLENKIAAACESPLETAVISQPETENVDK